jgi:hypothetical protein
MTDHSTTDLKAIPSQEYLLAQIDDISSNERLSQLERCNQIYDQFAPYLASSPAGKPTREHIADAIYEAFVPFGIDLEMAQAREVAAELEALWPQSPVEEELRAAPASQATEAVTREELDRSLSELFDKFSRITNRGLADALLSQFTIHRRQEPKP